MSASATVYPKGSLEGMVAEHPAAEVQTDKEMAKLVPCVVCGAELLTNVYYAPAIAKCATCKEAEPAPNERRERGSAAIVQAGRTDPAQAASLEACLVNRVEFAEMTCPFGCGLMELKSVNHNERYGPSKQVGFDRGQPVYKQVAVGETVLFQCNECKCCITMSTTAQHVFRAQNEPRPGKDSNAWSRVNGVRE